MRALILLMALAVVGCASQSNGPQSKSMTTPASTASAGTPTESIEARRLAAAKNLKMKVIDKDGQQLFCRSNLETGSLIQRDTTCYTADQLDHMQAQMQHELDRLPRSPSQSQALSTH